MRREFVFQFENPSPFPHVHASVARVTQLDRFSTVLSVCLPMKILFQHFRLLGSLSLGLAAIIVPAWWFRFCARWNAVSWTMHAKVSAMLIVFAALCVLAVGLLDRRRAGFKSDVPRLAAVAFCAAFFWAFVLPFSSFLANRSIFDFPAGALALQLLPRFVICFAAFLAAFVVALPSLGVAPALFIQGFLLYEYLETGILSADFPSLAGSADFFKDPSRQLADFAVLAACCGGFLVFGRRLRRCLHWVASALSVMLVASLADVRVADTSITESETDPCRQPADAVVENAFFSNEKNVLFFVLDAIDVQVADKVLSRNPDWKERLSGFTAYTNNVGMYSHTSYGVPGILTGEYSPYERMSFRYGASAVGTNAFFRPYVERGIPVFTVQSGLACGWSNVTNLPIARAEASNIRGGVSSDLLSRRTEANMAWNVAEITIFRALPFFEKADYLTSLLRMWNDGMDSSYKVESALFDRLSNAPVRDDVQCVLQFHHTKGGHIPFVRDRNGNKWSGGDSLEGYFEQSWYALSETVDFLDSLRRRGLYDNSTIVLLADHGLTYEHFRDVERNTHPFLWVKPPHATGTLAFSGEPTSHSKVHLVARAALDRDLATGEVTELLTQRDYRVSYTNERRIYYDPHFYDASGSPVQPPKNF